MSVTKKRPFETLHLMGAVSPEVLSETTSPVRRLVGRIAPSRSDGDSQ